MAVLYKANETDFNHLGLGPLNDAVSILVTEERNGMFELEMTYPIEGSRFNDLKLDRLIKADAGHNLKNQRFKIIRITKPIDGIVTVNAEHVSYLTQDLALKPTVNYSGSASQALSTWKSSIVDDNPFIVSSDITNAGSDSWSIKDVKNAREALGGVSGSILETYGGEYRFDNYSIRLMAKRGVNSGALIAYGRNLVDLTQEESIADTFTSVYPYAVYQDGNNKEVLLTLPEYFIDSEYVGNYARRKILPVDFSSDEIKDVANLRTRTTSYIKSNGVGIPKVNMKIQYVDLAKTLDYKDLAILEEVNLCDNVSIYFEQLGVNTSAKIIKTVWNELLDQYESIEVGEAKSSLSNSINATVDGKLETIVQLVNTIQLTADGLNLIYRGPEQPPPGNIGDLWYEPDGIYENMYQWDGVIWKLMLSTRDLNSVSEEVAKHTDEIAEVVESANDAVAKADQAIIDAGFIKLDVAQVKLDALTTANTAQTAYNNAISALSKADTAISTTGNLSLVVDDLERSLTFKADSSRVDTISGKVESQGLLIKANADSLLIKADKTLVDTISQTVSQHTNDISINAQAINARLTETQVNNLVNGKNYVNQTQLLTTANGLQLDITQVSSDLSNLEIGGRNLIIKNEIQKGYLSETGAFVSYSTHETTGFMPIIGNGKYIISSKKQNALNYVRFAFYDENKVFLSFVHYLYVVNTINILSPTLARFVRISVNSIPQYSELAIVKFEKGDKATDWSPAPEDMATLEKVVTIEANIHGINTLVASKASQTQVTQLATQWTQTTNLANGHTGQISNLGTDINLRVKRDELLSQINVQSNNILIQSGKLYLDAASVIFSGNAFIPSAAIASLTADKINAGTLNAANVNIINLNASNITAGIITGPNLAMNLNVGNLMFTNPSNGNTLIMDQGVIGFHNAGKSRYIEYWDEGLRFSAGTQNAGTSANTGLQLIGGHSYVEFISSLAEGGVRQRIEAFGNDLYAVHGMYQAFRVRGAGGLEDTGKVIAGSFHTSHLSGEVISLGGNNIYTPNYGNRDIYITPNGTGSVIVGTWQGARWNVKASDFVKQSSRTTKTNIVPLTEGLSLLNRLTPVSYNKIDKLNQGIVELEKGFISEDSLGVSTPDGLGIYDSHITAHLVKGIQELHRKVVSIDYVLIETTSTANNAMNKVLQVDSEVQQMKNKISELEKEIKTLKGAA